MGSSDNYQSGGSANAKSKCQTRTVDCHPFHNIRIFREHDDSLEVALYERCLYEWAA